jgi:hypothetical protein
MTSGAGPTQPKNIPLTEAIVASDLLSRYLTLLGVHVKLRVVDVASRRAIAVSPLWVEDANKLADALSHLSELRPYIATRRPAEPAEGATTP